MSTPLRRRDEDPRPSDVHPQAHEAVDLLALDHVALAVADLGAMAAFLRDCARMQELGHSGDALILGAGDHGASIWLLPAEGPREPGALTRLVLRVADLKRAAAALPGHVDVREEAPDLLTFEGPEGLGLGFALVAGGGIDYDLDHVVLRAADPEDMRIALAQFGCVPRGDALHIADKRIVLEELPAFAERPLLDHIAVRVESIEPVAAQAQASGAELGEARGDDTFSVVLPGPERISLHFVTGR